jgi:predicted DNA-binding helix-hairpin-helix protein
MGELRWRIDESKDARKVPKTTIKRAKPPRFSPAGQSTQMIVGADAADDRAILETSSNLYGNFQLRRVYYSAFSPIPDASSRLPLQAPPLVREHRLYQADWLLRFYGFGVEEIAPPGIGGMLALDIDPKLAWALRNPEHYPIDINRAPRETLLRVPGLGTKSVDRIIRSRGLGALRVGDLERLRVPLRKVLPFVSVLDHHPRQQLNDPSRLRLQLARPPAQGELFG